MNRIDCHSFAVAKHRIRARLIGFKYSRDSLFRVRAAGPTSPKINKKMENTKASNTPAYPRAVNHVDVGVADIERAIRWYGEVLGFTLLRGPLEIRAADPGSNIHDVLGQDCNALLQAHMVSVNGIGIELFQLLDPPHERRDPPLEYWRAAFSTSVSPTLISKHLLGASHPPVAASDQKSGGLTPRLTNTGCATAKILLATSLRSTPTITRLCTAG
jgi:hypothetical protein